MHPLRLILLSLLSRSAAAVFADEAWTVDYHHELLGAPGVETTFLHQPSPTSQASLIYTLSERGVLGAVNPRDGGIVWRHALVLNTSLPNAGFFRASQGRGVVISGAYSTVAAWSAADGRQEWSLDVQGLIQDLEILEVDDGRETHSAKDSLVLVDGGTSSVVRIDSATGTLKWQHYLDGGDVPFQVSASTTEIFAILLHKTLLGYFKIKVITLDPTNGRKTDEHMLSSDSELTSSDLILSVGANSASPIIAWTDASRSVLKVNLIGTKAIASFDIDKHGEHAVERIRLHAPYHGHALSHFLVHYESRSAHWADVFHVNLHTGKVEKAYSLPKLAGRGAFSTSTSDANVYFTRVTQDEVITVSSSSHGMLGRWPVSNFGVASADEVVAPVHAVSQVSVKDGAVSAVRSAVFLSTGDWVLLRDGIPVWQRAEVLADTVAAIFVSPTEVTAFAHELDIEAHDSPILAYLHRVTRHLRALQKLPKLLQAFPQAFINGFLGTTADADTAGDLFGFHQVIVCATKGGRLLALDAGNPERLLWARQAAVINSEKTWKPEISSPEGGILRLSGDGVVGTQSFNISTGELLVIGRPVPDETPDQDSRSVEFTVIDGALEAKVDGNLAWNFVPADGERFISIAPRSANDPVASIGKVLGDRRVLYKYLDPNIAVLVTAKHASQSATFHILNTVTGSVLHSSTHSGVELTAPISAVLSENWFAYSFTAESSEFSPKGHQLVVGELFESLEPNDRGPLPTATNFSSMRSAVQPFTLTQTYQIPETISKMAVTQTRQGITSRQLLAILPESNAIVGIPYSILDPRRPVNRDPTKDEQAEGLMRYSPVIEFDPKWYLTHQREVLGVDNVIASPALIESTSLIFAYGLDIFGTRLSPSFSFDILGRDFNKFQMLATVGALGVATVVVAPLVMRKQVNMRWQLL